jgi:alpha-ribazole phosphatase
MEIYIIRHTPVAVDKNTCYGQTDVDLADGFEIAIQKYLKELPENFDSVFSSPLLRCTKLAGALKLGPIESEPSLKELNFGNWENKKWNEINQDSLNHWMADFVNIRPPNGENLIELFTRVSIFLDHLRKSSHKKVLLVTHAGVIRCIWAYLLEIPLKNTFKIPVGFQEILHINLADKKENDSINRMA